MRARILTVGDELLIGQVVDTNAAWIGERLTALGVIVERVVTAPDHPGSIRSELERALASADVVILTGGLGPTHDDVTRTAVSDLYGAGLRTDQAVLERIRARFARRGLEMTESSRSVALVPDGFEARPNPVGTAPGLRHGPVPDRGWGELWVLPGVPHEMTRLMEDEVLPGLSRADGLRFIAQKTLLTTGVGESRLQETIDPPDGVAVSLAFLPSVHGVRLRVTGRGETREEAEAHVAMLERHLRDRVGPFIFGEGAQTLEEVTGGLMRSAGLTVSTAESCTGGLVASRLTDVAGSSDYVIGGVVAYDNRIKTGVLGVDPAALAAHGAVSRPVAEAMATGVRAAMGTDIGLAATGIMGPGGGTDLKPVGTVWIALADDAGVKAVQLRLGEDRLRNKQRTSTAVLDLLRRHLLGREEG